MPARQQKSHVWYPKPPHKIRTGKTHWVRSHQHKQIFETWRDAQLGLDFLLISFPEAEPELEVYPCYYGGTHKHRVKKHFHYGHKKEKDR